MTTSRVADVLKRDLFAFEDETNPQVSRVQGIWPATVLDQVFDQYHPTRKNLREIIADLRQEIISGGLGNIPFPVTSVNGQSLASGQADVIISAASLGLGRVDNTRDVDKPVSHFQEARIRQLLSEWDFSEHVDYTTLYEHLKNKDNPHGVSWEQINQGSEITDFVNGLIFQHNIDTNSGTHRDIRRNITELWNHVTRSEANMGSLIAHAIDKISNHMVDLGAHADLFLLKEELINKVPLFNKTMNNDHTLYPSTRAVVEFVDERVGELIEEELDERLDGWVRSIKLIGDTTELPAPSEDVYMHVYVITSSPADPIDVTTPMISNVGNYVAIAVCRKNDSDVFYWDVKSTRAISRLHPDHFISGLNGYALRPDAILNILLDAHGGAAANLWDTVFTREEADARFLQNVTLVPGTMDGHIQYYLNNDQTTMRQIPIVGLHLLAYKDFVTEKEIADNAVHERHILSQAVSTRTIEDLAVTANQWHPKIACTWGSIIGNTGNEGTMRAHEIPLPLLADYLRPLIGGWPDPGTPGGNPWVDSVRDMILSPHLYEPGVEYDLHDGSFAMRFTGHISCLPNQQFVLDISETIRFPSAHLIDAGGVFQMSINVNGGEWTILGGSNITGHTFGSVVMDHVSLKFVSISTGNRYESPYDIWVRYSKGTGGTIPGPGPTYPPEEPPTFTLSSNTMVLNDTTLTGYITLAGTAGGPIMIDRLNIPNEIQMHLDGNRILFVATRPYFDTPIVTGTFMMVVHRAGISRVISVQPHLTPHNDPMVFSITPNRVTITDHQRVGTFMTIGTSNEPVTFDRMGLPSIISTILEVPTNDGDGNFSNHNGSLILSATRPVSPAPGIQGIFPISITRQGITVIRIIDVNLTPIPLVTLLSQDLVQLNDTTLSTSVVVGGTSTGTITADDSNSLPSNITLTIDQTNNAVVITATRPPSTGSGTTSDYMVRITREGVGADLRILSDITPLP